LTTHDILAEILPPLSRQNDNKNWRCHTECSEAYRLAAHDILAEILTPSGVLRDPPFGRQNDSEKWRCHAEHSKASRLTAHDILIEKQDSGTTVLLLIFDICY